MVCKNNSGVIVADSLCPQPKPATSQPANCSTSNPVNGVCGTVEQTCSAGTVANYDNYSHTWECEGSNGGNTDYCSMDSVAQCGTAHMNPNFMFRFPSPTSSIP